MEKYEYRDLLSLAVERIRSLERGYKEQEKTMKFFTKKHSAIKARSSELEHDVKMYETIIYNLIDMPLRSLVGSVPLKDLPGFEPYHTLATLDEGKPIVDEYDHKYSTPAPAPRIIKRVIKVARDDGFWAEREFIEGKLFIEGKNSKLFFYDEEDALRFQRGFIDEANDGPLKDEYRYVSLSGEEEIEVIEP